MMGGLQYRIATQSLRMNPLRTALTTLGIIIGVASITLILSLGGGIQETVRRQVSTLNNNVIAVKPGFSDPSVLLGKYNPAFTTAATTLTESDLNTMRLNGAVAKVAPIMILGGTAKTAEQSAEGTPIVATSPELMDILRFQVNPGQFIDDMTDRETAVIGQKLALELYGTDQILGQQIQLKGRTHTIIGVIKNTNAPINLSGVDIDRAVFVTFDDGKSFNQGIAEIHELLATVKDPATMEDVGATIQTSLLANHQGERDFTVLTGQKIADHNDAFFQAIVFITALVATITLIVGGIGIMNIMLVGVSERTREIGIRKALGATNSHILGQFLIEALIMCIVGGLIGLAIAYGLAFAIATSFHFQPAITWQISLAGLGMAFATGILFGIYPAIKAARKDPIESLRQYQ